MRWRGNIAYASAQALKPARSREAFAARKVSKLGGPSEVGFLSRTLGCRQGGLNQESGNQALNGEQGLQRHLKAQLLVKKL